MAEVETGLDDRELLALFRREPERAWRLFLDRYASFMLAELRRHAAGYDAAMDVFVHVCERLAEDGFRRLTAVSPGERGDLEPWLRTVLRNARIDLREAREGRRRLLGWVSKLPARDQRIFQLTFWQGLRASEALEQLRREAVEIAPADFFASLERLFEALSERRLWHLLARQGGSEERGDIELVASGERSPEERALQRDAEARLGTLLAGLAPRSRLVVKLRYEDALGLDEIAAMLGVSPRTIRRELEAALASLRAGFEDKR